MKRYPQLDLIRAIAIVLVLFRHMHLEEAALLPASLHAFYHILHATGWIGVDLFFVLSGFLVSGLFFSEWDKQGTFRFGRFYLKRAFRIIPGFYLLLLGTWLLHVSGLLTVGNQGWKSYVSEMLFLQSYKGGVYMHTWSLAVEEHFYLLMPLTLYVLIKWKREHLLRYLLLFIAAIVAIRVISLYTIGTYPIFEFRSQNRMDSLLIGVAVRYLFAYRREQLAGFLSKAAPVLWPVSVLLAAYCAWAGQHSFFNAAIGFTLLALCFGFWIFSWMNTTMSEQGSTLRKVMIEIGKASYALYLWHEIANSASRPLIQDGSLLHFHLYMTCYFGGSILAGLLLTHTVEHYFLLLRERLFSETSSKA